MGRYRVKNKVQTFHEDTNQTLPAVERHFYVFIWAAIVIYICYLVYESSISYTDDLDTYHITQGWSLINRKKDSSDFEWDFWTSYFSKGLPLLIGHIVVGQLCCWLDYSKNLKLVYVCFSTYALSVLLGFRVVLLLIAHIVIVFLCAKTRSSKITTIVAVLLVSTLNSSEFVAFMKDNLITNDDTDSKIFYLVMFVTAMCNLRYTSFALEKCWYLQKKTEHERCEELAAAMTTENDSAENDMEIKKDSLTKDLKQNLFMLNKSKGSIDLETKGTTRKLLGSNASMERVALPAENEESPKVKMKTASQRSKVNKKTNRNINNNSKQEWSTDDYCRSEKEIGSTIEYSIIDAIFYVFYLPLFCTGPLVTYNKFLIQWNKKLKPCNSMSIFIAFLRVLWWALFCEIVLHYFYFSSMMANEQLLAKVSLWHMAGIGLCQGQFFMVKYVVMFGLPAAIARLDQIEAPEGPRCISVVYKYSDMWKYFDRGLYDFMKRYIYIPLGGSHFGLFQKLFASFCCFAFVFIWHGAEFDLFVWSALNFVGVSFEALASSLTATSQFQALEKRAPHAVLRLKALAAVPLFIMSIFAIFVFFRGIRVGLIYYQRFIQEGDFLSVVTLWFALYCCIQTSIELDNSWRKKKEKQD